MSYQRLQGRLGKLGLPGDKEKLFDVHREDVYLAICHVGKVLDLEGNEVEDKVLKPNSRVIITPPATPVPANNRSFVQMNVNPEFLRACGGEILPQTVTRRSGMIEPSEFDLCIKPVRKVDLGNFDYIFEFRYVWSES